MLSCQWAQPYWPPRICVNVRTSRECDVLARLGPVSLNARTFTVKVPENIRETLIYELISSLQCLYI